MSSNSNKSSASKKAVGKKNKSNKTTAAKISDAPASPSEEDQQIAYCMIHPGLGIARVGNSDEDFFIGPEAPGNDANPPGGFKDPVGRIKRQAARFRIYAYNKEGVAIKELTADDADITWTVELANGKAAYEMFLGMYWAIQYPAFNKVHPLRNQEIPGNLGDPQRDVLIIKPPPVTITGKSKNGADHQFDGGTIGPLPYTIKTKDNTNYLPGSRSGFMNVYPFKGQPACVQSFPPPAEEWTPGEIIPPTAMSAQVEVNLGELRTDEQGRLLVLGGHGHSGSLIPDNKIGDLNMDSYYANNDYWYDDTSDGSVAAKVVLKDGTEVKVADKAWVIVAPPKYSPHTQVLTTLYDVAMDTAAKLKPTKKGDGNARLSFTQDIFPILLRLSEYQWVNAQASRQHGAGKVYDILDPARLELFRTPGNKDPDAVNERKHLFERMRVPVDLLPGKTLLGKIEGDLANSQANYRYMPQMAGNGGEPVVNGIQDDECTPGGTYVTWMTLSVNQYQKLEQWSKGNFVNDWPVTPDGNASSPDQLPAPPTLSEIGVAEQPAALDEAALEYCVGESTYPGIEMTYISHDPKTWSAPCRINQSFEPGDITRHMALPWQADFAECKDHWWPAQRPDDVVPEAEYQDLLKTYNPQQDGPLAQILAAVKPWARGIHTESPDLDNDMVTAWKDFGFVVQKRGPGDQLVYVETERAPYAGLGIRDYFYYLMNIESYPDFLPQARVLVEESLKQAEANQQEASLDSASARWSFFEYTQEAFEARLNQIYNGYVTGNSSDSAAEFNLMQTRADVINNILQSAPFNQLDGAWLRGATPPGPLDAVHELIFSIYMDELGDGKVEWNHCNVYTDLLKSVNIYLPDLHTRDYADYPDFIDSAFTLPVFLLAISQFSQDYFPEILGMTMYLEWGSIGLIPTVDTFNAFGIDPLYYTLHVGIDNAASGHGALAKRAIEIYLDEVRESQGEQMMHSTWKRIWNGYVAFGTLGTFGQELADASTTPLPTTYHDEMVTMIKRKAPYASLNHRQKTLGPNYINDWFLNPEGFLTEMEKSGIIIAGQPDISPIFQLMSFTGPMFHVFTDDEQQLWRDYIESLGKKPEPSDYQIVEKMHELIDYLRRRQEGNVGHNVQLMGPNPDPKAKPPGAIITLSIHDWFDLNDDEAVMKALSYEQNGWILRGNAAQSPLVTDMLGGNNDMAVAFRDIAPGTGGKTYKEILVEWIQKGCPVRTELEASPLAKMRVLARAPQPAGVRVTAQALGDEPRQRKIWGMGKVH